MTTTEPEATTTDEPAEVPTRKAKPKAEPEPAVQGSDEGERFIDWMRVRDLIPAPKNPKRHDLKTLRASLKRFGSVEAPVLDERTGRLVAGHGRAETYRDLEAGGDSPPTGVKVDEGGAWVIAVQRGWYSTDDVEASAYVVTSNRSSELGGWDDALLDETLAEVAESDLGLEGVGFEAPIDDLPSTKIENLTPLRYAHALVSYAVDLHADVAPILAQLEAVAGVRMRATVNDSAPGAR